MNNRNELISYALDFVSYLVGRVEGVERVVLFGSIARGDFTVKSDVDLFIDTTQKKLEKVIPLLIEDFYRTEKAKRWALKGVKNLFSVIVGELDGSEWKDLKRAIITEGVVLLGKYKSDTDKVYQYVVFSFQNIVPESRRVSVHRSLFGFGMGGKQYKGLVHKYKGFSFGKGTIVIPVESAREVKKFFKERKVGVKVYDIWSDYDLN